MGSLTAPHFILRVVALRRRAVAVMVVTGAMLAFGAAALAAHSFGQVIMLELCVHREDVGEVIGWQGRIAKPSARFSVQRA
jgi:hypothetical protein